VPSLNAKWLKTFGDDLWWLSSIQDLRIVRLFHAFMQRVF